MSRRRNRRKTGESGFGPWGAAATIATVFATSVTALTLWLGLLGYGYDLAYLGEFGLSPEQLGRGPSDFLLRSYRPFLVMTEGLAKFISWEMQKSFLLLLAWPAAGVGAVAAALLAMSAYGYSLWRRGATAQEQWVTNGVSALWSSGFARNGRRVLSRCVRPLRVVRNVWDNGATRWLISARLIGYGGGLVAGSVFVVIAYLLVAAFAFCLGVAILAVVTWPLSATEAGQRVAREEVILPKGCAKLGGTQTAHCVRVLVQGCEVARGRLIDRSATRIFLFVQAQRGYVELPLEGSVVEQVNDENAQRQPCPGK